MTSKVSEEASFHALREYFRDNWENDRRERGCLLLVSGEIVPFDNASPEPEVMIDMDREGVRLLARYFNEDRIAAVAHSHPVFQALPSRRDLDNHQYGDMIIYSCIYDKFLRLTPQQVLNRRDDR